MNGKTKDKEWQKGVYLFECDNAQAISVCTTSECFIYYFYQHGHLGSVRAVVDENGVTEERNNADYIYGRQWNVMKRFGYNYLESSIGKVFK